MTRSSCYWERLSGLSGDLDDIITNDNTTEQGIVEIASTDVAFNSSGCDGWSAFLPGEVLSSFGGGDWAVGSQIVPGVYRADGGDDGCYWERGSDFSHEFSGIITNDIGDERPTVEISASDARFTSNGCGIWSLG